MFDLQELERAETALRNLRGEAPSPRRDPKPAPQGDLSRCPFHNGAMQREIAA